MKLSIVVCVFNTDKNLFKECIDSVMSSTIEDFELVIVDDGSSLDYSDVIPKENFIKYTKTENQGTFLARVLGAQLATGDYVCYLDSDDTVSPLFYSALKLKAEQSQADIVLNDWAFHTDNSKYFCKKDTTICKNLCYMGDLVLEKFMEQSGLQHSFYVLWNKAIKRDVLLDAVRELQGKLESKMLFAEDVLIMFYVSKHAKKMVNTHVGHYYYRIHSNQQISATTEEKLKHHICSMAKVFDVMQSELNFSGMFENNKTYFENWKKLLAYGEYAEAKRQGYKNLVPIIKQKYGLTRLKTHFPGMSKFYDGQQLLPLNLDSVDLHLKKVYYSNKYLKIYKKVGKYAKWQLGSLVELTHKKCRFEKKKKNANLIFPKEKYSIKQCFLHNTFVYKAGIILFPKGSKIRKKLKEKL